MNWLKKRKLAAGRATWKGLADRRKSEEVLTDAADWSPFEEQLQLGGPVAVRRDILGKTIALHPVPLTVRGNHYNENEIITLIWK